MNTGRLARNGVQIQVDLLGERSREVSAPADAGLRAAARAEPVGAAAEPGSWGPGAAGAVSGLHGVSKAGGGAGTPGGLHGGQKRRRKRSCRRRSLNSRSNGVRCISHNVRETSEVITRVARCQAEVSVSRSTHGHLDHATFGWDPDHVPGIN